MLYRFRSRQRAGAGGVIQGSFNVPALLDLATFLPVMPEGMVAVAGEHILSQTNKVARYSSNFQLRVYI